MSLKAIWTAIQAGCAGVGAWVGAWLGGVDGLIYALLGFVVADYVTGVLAAIAEKRVNSTVGFRGISRKILIFTLVGLAHLLDVHVLGHPGVLRTAVIFFYLSNEGISLVENATRLGLPVPAPLRNALDAIAKRSDTNKPPATPEETPPGRSIPVGEGTQPATREETPPAEDVKPPAGQNTSTPAAASTSGESSLPQPHTTTSGGSQ